MRKIFLIATIVFVLMIPISTASNIVFINENEKNEILVKNSTEEFTHTPIVEYVGKTTCPHCVTASSQLKSIYNSGDLDFYYVTMVTDKSTLNVIDRINELGVQYVPDVFFDGDYKDLVGGQSNEQPYRNAITQAGERDVHDIDVSLEVNWLGGSLIRIKITVTNNEAETFNGHIRTYILEKESRWQDRNGNPFSYAVLDIPIDKSIAVISNMAKPAGDTFTFKRTWVGLLHGFGDITKDNIMVVASVFDSSSGYAFETAAGEPATKVINYSLSNILLFKILQKFLQNGPIIGLLEKIYT